MIQTNSTLLAVAQALITLRDQNKSLIAEAERLRAALNKISKVADCVNPDDIHVAVWRIAKEALEQNTTTEKGGEDE